MKKWVSKALGFLELTLQSPKHELNEIDWKAALSPDKKRIAEHISAFSNHPSGGCLAFGIASSGLPVGVDEEEIETIINQLANIGRQGVEPPVAIDHAVVTYRETPILLVRIPEANIKPVHLRGKDVSILSSVLEVRLGLPLVPMSASS